MSKFARCVIQCQPGSAQISVSLFVASKSAFSRSLHDCRTGVWVREGATEVAGEGVLDAALLAKLWNMLPNTLDDPGLDSGECSVCAKLDGDAC